MPCALRSGLGFSQARGKKEPFDPVAQMRTVGDVKTPTWQVQALRQKHDKAFVRWPQAHSLDVGLRMAPPYGTRTYPNLTGMKPFVFKARHRFLKAALAEHCFSSQHVALCSVLSAAFGSGRFGFGPGLHW